MTRIVPVILCGGSGTRLWPRSRATMPKPFLPLVGEATLFEATLARCVAGDDFAEPVVVTGTAHLAHVEAQAPANARVIVEPSARNTAAAIALAALRLPSEAVMLVCPSDHHIGDSAAFVASARAAAGLARDGWLVAFGIAAQAPETGFGYIRQGEPLGDSGFSVARFVEKPDLATAEGFLADGRNIRRASTIENAEDFLFGLAQQVLGLVILLVGLAEDLRAGIDQRTIGRLFPHDACVVDGVSGIRNGFRNAVQVRHAADALEITR